MARWKRENLEPVYTYLPVNMPAVSELIKGTDLNPDRLRVVLHSLFLVRMLMVAVRNDDNRTRFRSGLVSLSSQMLRRIATNDYKRYLDLLKDKEIIYEEQQPTGGKSYLAGKFSARFRLNPKYLGLEIGKPSFRKELVTDYKTLKASYREKTRYQMGPDIAGKSANLKPIHEALLRMMDEVWLDLDGLCDYVKAKATAQITQDEMDYLLEMPDYFMALNDGLISWGKVDSYGERLHTPFTNLKKELRKFIHFKDEPLQPLMCLDISNSQPYFASICGNKKIITELLPEFSTCLQFVEQAQHEKDCKMFADLCSSGKIYEFWMAKRHITRDEAKNEILKTVMYERNNIRYAKGKAIRLAFKKIFPSVYDLFYSIKQLNEDALPFIRELYVDTKGKFMGKAALHKNLSCMMQRVESRMILNRISTRLIEAGVKFLTVHDSFIVNPKQEQVVRNIIESEFRMLGVVPPKLKSTLLV